MYDRYKPRKVQYADKYALIYCNRNFFKITKIKYNLPTLSSTSPISAHSPFPSNFASASSKTFFTFQSLGVNLTRNGTGDLPASPSYSFKLIGSSGSCCIEKAHSKRDIVSQISRSATIVPGQMRRLDKVAGLVFFFFFFTAKERGQIEGVREREGEGVLPGSEHPVIAVVRVGLFGAFGGTERVGNVPIGLCGGEVNRRLVLLQIKRGSLCIH